MNMLVFWSLAGLLCLSSLWLGMRDSKAQDSVSEFFVCQSNLRLASLMLTILATQLGGGSIIGTAEAAYQNGWVSIFYSFGISLGLMVMAFTIGPALRSFGAMTIAQVIGKIYKSSRLQFVASILSIITLSFILIAIAVSCRKVFLSLGFDSPWFLVGFWSVLIGYTTFGGLRAVVITDKLQVIFILAVFAIILYFLGADFIALPKTEAFWTAEQSSVPWSSWVLMPMCFMLISQDMGQRCFAAESNEGIRKAMIGGSLLLIVATLVPVFMGILGKNMGLSLGADSVFMSVVKNTLPPTIISFVAIAVLMAIISTADSLLCALSSNIALDLFNSKSVGTSRFVTLLFGILSLILSLSVNDIIPMMLAGYALSVFALLVPFCMGLWLKDVTEAQGIFSLCIGVAGFFLVTKTKIPGAEIISLTLSVTPYMPSILKRKN